MGLDSLFSNAKKLLSGRSDIKAIGENGGGNGVVQQDTNINSQTTEIDSPILVDEKGEVNNTSVDTTAISQDVQDSVNSIFEDNDRQKLRYAMISLINKNLGISTHSIDSADYSPDTLNIKIPGRYKDDGSIPTLLLQETLKNKDAKLHDETTLHLGRISIELMSYGFRIKSLGKIRETDLELLRGFFEGVFLRHYLVNEQSAINISQIRKLLELSDKDFVLIEEKSLEIQLSQEVQISITRPLIAHIANELNNSSEDYGVKVKTGLYNLLDSQSPILVIHNLVKKSKYEIHFTFHDEKLIVRISNSSYSNLELDRNFLETIVKKGIYLLTSATLKKKDSLVALREMGVLVFEKDAEAPKKSLDELYIEDGFVGYEDIKELLAVNIIYPWEQRETYIKTSQELFPHMKNIIPNTALFEGPPGTGKTTQAKIIGKYLGYPFIYIPIGKLMSKWYGESEGRLDRIFELARKAAIENGGIIVMIDEIDEIGKNREDSHEATARMTGVLLKKLDGIEQVGNLLLIGSTNRKDSMDPALLSRFSRQVFFRLPENTREIQDIFTFYIPEARGLDSSLFEKMIGKSPRDIKNISEDIARKFLEIKHIHKDEPNMEQLIRDHINS